MASIVLAEEGPSQEPRGWFSVQVGPRTFETRRADALRYEAPFWSRIRLAWVWFSIKQTLKTFRFDWWNA